jgi:hypothetical protein
LFLGQLLGVPSVLCWVTTLALSVSIHHLRHASRLGKIIFGDQQVAPLCDTWLRRLEFAEGAISFNPQPTARELQ